MEKIGFGGSCHWCTEAIFLSLKGIFDVSQGWIAPSDQPDRYSEAVIVKFDPAIITLEMLIAVHLQTHSCTSRHSMRDKYRSAIYCYNHHQAESAMQAITRLQADFSDPIITEVVLFEDFKINKPAYLKYYYNDPSRPFCQNIVNPKLRELIALFKDQVDSERVGHLISENRLSQM